METDRDYIYPFEAVFCAYPPAYLAPEQSRFHNLGMNGYIQPGKPYPDKRPGFVGDYGPRQEGYGESVRHGVYPLDVAVTNFNNRNEYRMLPYIQPMGMSYKSLGVLASGLGACNKPY